MSFPRRELPPVERAWRCWVPRIDGDPIVNCGIYRATTRAKARYRAFLNYSDAFEDAEITHVRVRRAPEFDDVALPPHVEGSMPRYIEREPAHA